MVASAFEGALLPSSFLCGNDSVEAGVWGLNLEHLLFAILRFLIKLIVLGLFLNLLHPSL